MSSTMIAWTALLVSIVSAAFTGWSAISDAQTTKANKVMADANKAMAMHLSAAVLTARIIGPNLVITNIGNGTAEDVVLTFPTVEDQWQGVIPGPDEYEPKVLYPHDQLTRSIENPMHKGAALGIDSVTIAWADSNGPQSKAFPLTPSRPAD